MPQVIALLALLAAVVLPLLSDKSERHQTWTVVIAFALSAVSVVVLTGWGGQLSLGQMAFAGPGRAHRRRADSRPVREHRLARARASSTAAWAASPFLWALLIGASFASLVAVLVGVGALRVRGLLLAISTLAFAIAAQVYLFNRPFFTAGFSTVQIPRIDMTRSFSTTRTSSRCACCLVTSLPESRMSGIEVAQFEVELAQRLAETESPVAALEPRVEPRVYERDGFVITLWTYYEPVTPRRSHQPTTRMRSSGCMPACGSSMSRRRTSRIASRRRNNSSRAATARRRSPTRTGSFSAPRCEACDERSATAAPRSSCCTASRTRATCSARRTGRGSSTSRRVAVGRSNSTSPMCPKRSASAIRTLDQELLGECRVLVLAMVAAWRWDRGDQFPNGQRAARELLSALREGPPWPALDVVMRRLGADAMIQ